MIRKGRKSRKFRGSKTHGYGSMKKHRGAGSRGGRGMAGTGKKGDVKKPSINPSTYFGRHGFKSKIAKVETIINVEDLGRITQEKEGVINLQKQGYTRLLGKGNVPGVFEVIVAAATARAIEKVESAGGKITISIFVKKQVREEPAAKEQAA